MTFKAIAFSSMATATLVAGSLAITPSAQAATIGRLVYNVINGGVNSGAIQGVGAGGVDFNNVNIYTADAASTGAYAGKTFKFLNDLPATFTAPFNFIQIQGAGGPTLTITGFTTTYSPGTIATRTYDNITGYASDGVVSHPFLSSTSFTTSTYGTVGNSTFALGAGQFDVVPTPALLPGLLGMGLAAWRKRKQEAMEELEA